MPTRPLQGAALAIFGTLVLTPDTLFMRWSEMEGFAMLAWRGLLMGPLLIGLWLVRAGGGAWRGTARALCAPAGLGVITCHALNATLFSLGVWVAPVSVVLFGVATVPVFAAIFSRALMGEVASAATWAATAAVLSGIALAVSGGAEPGSMQGAFLGALAGLGVAAALALSFVLIRKTVTLPILPAIGTGSCLAGLAGLALASPGALLSGNPAAIAVTGALILPVSFLAISHATRKAPATTVSLILLLETVFGPAWVWVGAGEAMSLREIAGGAVVVGSLAVYIRFAAREARAPNAAKPD
ncbi:hypothetical protein DEA8626_00274 [Defluviimonas aquaemixtae]|uniref:EamA domain-containing protein n=1 Tax=Albidovulum aquaemixtae TaxID=1542388 RepID=A0A2R8B2L1_9RHOB|nr:DMT family transporter [Defluviimonas aquaemixtae]SPH16763.1 hypothetical protein DEA8626_00274 [Defluviimonas aquaemixtae]